MKTRIITAIIGLPVLVALLYLGGFYRFLVALVLSSIGILEYARAVDVKLEHKTKKALIVLLNVAIQVVMKINYQSIVPLLSVCVILIFCAEVFGQKADAYRAIASIFGLLYVSLMFGYLSLFETFPSGTYYLWLVFVVAFVTDTAAYFTGMFLGKHKLAPKISPKKTVEGAIGGTVFSMIGTVVYGIIMQFGFDFVIPFYFYILLGLVGSVAAQCGDLCASMMKRKVEIKDFGKLLPGHGGVLDRFDSILFVLPIVYIFASMTFGYL